MRTRAYAERDIVVERNLVLRLRTTKNGSVLLYAVNENGGPLPGGSLLTVSENGVYLSSGISEHLGFDLNEDNRLKILNPYDDHSQEV